VLPRSRHGVAPERDPAQSSVPRVLR
jgi:hypothetical protein